MAQPEIADLGAVILALGLGSSLTNADRALLTQCKSFAESMVRKYLQHNVTQPATPYVHYLPDRQLWSDSWQYIDTVGDKVYWRVGGESIDRLQLMPYLRSITSIYEDPAAFAGTASGAWGAGTLLTSGVDYYADFDESGICNSGLVLRIGTNWSTRPRSIKATYISGLTADELDGAYSDIKEVVVDETIDRFKWRKSQSGADSTGAFPIKSERLGGEYSVTYDTDFAKEQGEGLSRGSREKLEDYLNFQL